MQNRGAAGGSGGRAILGGRIGAKIRGPARRHGASAVRRHRRGSTGHRGNNATMLKTYRGSCHCGAVTFEAELDLAQPTYRCNCSICRRTRFWPAIARPEGFRVLTGEAELTRYVFHTKNNHHYFCRHCGVRAFGIGNETPIGPLVGVHVGCLDGVDDATLAALPITYVDGLHDRQTAPAFFAHL